MVARIRGWLRWWVTPIKRPNRTEKVTYNPKRTAIGTAVGIALILGYFYYFQPYKLTDPVLFWLAFVAWATPPALVGWFYRNATKRRYNTATGRVLLGFGFTGIMVYVISTGTHLLDPLALSAWPALIAGAIVGTDLALIWRLRKGS